MNFIMETNKNLSMLSRKVKKIEVKFDEKISSLDQRMEQFAAQRKKE